MLLGVNPIPTPTEPGCPRGKCRARVRHQLQHSRLPVERSGVRELLMAYFEGRLNQDELYLPVDNEGNPIDGERGSATPRILRRNAVHGPGRGRRRRATRIRPASWSSTTPPTSAMSRTSCRCFAPLQLLGEPGNRLADAMEPATRAVVDYGYPYNDPLAAPDEYIPARVIPRPGETATFVSRFHRGCAGGAGDTQRRCAGGGPPYRSRGGGKTFRPSRPRTQRRPPNGSRHSAWIKDSLDFTPKRLGESGFVQPRIGPDQHGDQGEPGPTHQEDRTAPDNGDADTDGGAQDPGS